MMSKKEFGNGNDARNRREVCELNDTMAEHQDHDRKRNLAFVSLNWS